MQVSSTFLNNVKERLKEIGEANQKSLERYRWHNSCMFCHFCIRMRFFVHRFSVFHTFLLGHLKASSHNIGWIYILVIHGMPSGRDITWIQRSKVLSAFDPLLLVFPYSQS